MPRARVHQLKQQAVTYGLFVLFILKFGKFVVLEAWDVIGPIVQWLLAVR